MNFTLMRNLSLILICTVFYSCQVLDKREVVLNPTFCKKCEAPLKEMLLKEPSIFVVKFNDDKLFYNYDASMLDVDSLENELMQRGFLPRKDSIVMYPVCCSKGSKQLKDTIN